MNNKAGDRAQRQLATYMELYKNVPRISERFTVSTRDAFDYCARRTHFVLIIPYTLDHRILAERTFAENDISWSLLGGSLRKSANEDFIVAASRIARYTLTSIDLADLEPIAFLDNEFNYIDLSHHHNGVAYMARIRGEDIDDRLGAAERTRGHLIDPETPAESIALPHNAKVFKLAQEYLRGKGTGWVPFHDHEISENLRYRTRYQFHDIVVKPALRFASSRFRFEYTIDDLNAEIDRMIVGCEPRSLIDVACGENDLCGKLAANGSIPIVVGNDVSWSQIELIQKGRRATDVKSSLLYTNHDATSLPFDDKTFSVSICKNVLHHMPSAAAVDALIEECIRISSRAVIIEVMDPTFESAWGRLRHRYYLDFLKDAAVHFYSADEFNKATSKGSLTQRFDMKTIRGVYQFAVFGS